MEGLPEMCRFPFQVREGADRKYPWCLETWPPKWVLWRYSSWGGRSHSRSAGCEGLKDRDSEGLAAGFLWGVEQRWQKKDGTVLGLPPRRGLIQCLFLLYTVKKLNVTAFKIGWSHIKLQLSLKCPLISPHRFTALALVCQKKTWDWGFRWLAQHDSLEARTETQRCRPDSKSCRPLHNSILFPRKLSRSRGAHGAILGWLEAPSDPGP